MCLWGDQKQKVAGIVCGKWMKEELFTAVLGEIQYIHMYVHVGK